MTSSDRERLAYGDRIARVVLWVWVIAGSALVVWSWP